MVKGSNKPSGVKMGQELPPQNASSKERRPGRKKGNIRQMRLKEREG